MTWKVNKWGYNFVLLFICTLSTDLIIKLIRGSNALNWATMRLVISSIIISYGLSYIFSKFKDKTTLILNLSYVFLIGIYAVLQLGFYRYIGTYMSFNSSSQAYKVLDFFFDFISSISAIYYLALIPFGVLVIINFIVLPILRKKKIFTIKFKTEKLNLKFLFRAVIKTSIMLFLIFIYYLTLIAPFMQSRYQFEKNIDVFKNPENQSVAVEQFGLTMFFLLDVNSYLFPSEPPIEIVPIPAKKPPVVTDYSRKINDELWNLAKEKETSARIKQLNNYFISRNITEKNQHTGLFKDKNIIVIMMESVGMLGINEELFPTLYKLWDEGITFTNFYSPRNSCPTGNNEMTAMVGLYTINNSCTADAYRRNIYPQAIFNLFREQNYYSTSYHNYIDYYYPRKMIHANAGSQTYYNATDLGIKGASAKQWPSDVELFEKGLPYFIEQDKFMSFMTTVTGHSPYNIDSVYGAKNFDLFAELPITNALKRYYSKIYELDLGLKYLLEELERTKKLDDTVIVLFGDHQPYSLGVKQQTDILGEEYELNKNLEKTPFIIYNAKTPSQKNEAYVSIVDILPTIANLFDLNYDPRYYVGEDMFDPNVHHRAIFTDGSWQDEIGFYNASNDRFIPNDPLDLENVYTDEEILAINTEISLRQKMSMLAIRSNYFYHLNASIEKVKNK